MKNICVLFLYFVLTISHVNAQKIYQVMKADEADVKIMLVMEADSSDLNVFFVDDEDQSTLPGCWFVCDFPDKAEKKIYFTEDENEADIKIFIVENMKEAGWVNEKKKAVFN